MERDISTPPDIDLIRERRIDVDLSIPRFYEAGDHMLGLGKSFSPHNITIRPDIDALDVTQPDTTEKVGGEFSFDVEVLDESSAKSWDKAFDIKVSARYLKSKVKASYSNREELDLSSRSLTIAIKAIGLFGRRYIKVDSLSKEAKRVLDEEKMRFVTMFGSHYIQAVDVGGFVAAYLTLENVSEESKRQIKKAASLGLGFGSFGASVSSAFSDVVQEAMKKTRATIDVRTLHTAPPVEIINALSGPIGEKDLLRSKLANLGSSVGIITNEYAGVIRYYPSSLAGIDPRITPLQKWSDDKEKAVQKVWNLHYNATRDILALQQFVEKKGIFYELVPEMRNTPFIHFEGVELVEEGKHNAAAVDYIDVYRNELEETHRSLLQDPNSLVSPLPSKNYTVTFNYPDYEYVADALEEHTTLPSIRLYTDIEMQDGGRTIATDRETELLLSTERSNRFDTLIRLYPKAVSFKCWMTIVGLTGLQIKTVWRTSSGTESIRDTNLDAGTGSLFSGGDEFGYWGGIEEEYIDFLSGFRGDWTVSAGYQFRDRVGRFQEFEWLTATFSVSKEGILRGSLSVSSREVYAVIPMR
jgi:hypothetical protein